ncbi:IS110 family RNA-guided transposase [Caldinitratiruptor microaerophilus]|uniref:IS110 family transposase n=1 Tax=Caldinitratiruptor microaerophilus TaxID=671077 RepID=A0AA35G7Q3_9FIRM|nr:IS110 family transposase [Caldinitratiruptor microaerophilus]BDG60321.1 IS110 family transposase [Caldinitratiruptor microaerophilus]
MQVVYERCSGLDIHKKTVTACVITPEGKETRTFGTMTGDLLMLGDWLESRGVTHVAMESTGVYWKPVYNVLEGYEFELLVVNAQHIKAVPGRKTDVKDAEWIAELLRHGLLRGSYIPSRPERELRELVRYRKSLIRERTTVVNRIQKVLEGANIKLASVATDVLGKSGRAMLEALIAGQTDPVALAALAKGRLQEKRDQLEQALQGAIGSHQRMLLRLQLQHVDFLDRQIEELSREIDERMLPFEESLRRIETIPGVGRRTAEMLLAEIGPNVSRFPSAAHLASWAGMCPGNNESAGKRRTGRTRKGSPWLREALVEAARAAAPTRNTYLSAQYHRLAARRGANRAAVAIGHTILVIVYHILRNGTTYQDLGANYFDERDKAAVIRKAVRRIQSLGYKVTVEPNAA